MNFDLTPDQTNTVLSALQLQAAATQNAIAALQMQLPREPQTGPGTAEDPALGKTVSDADGWIPHTADANRNNLPEGLSPSQAVQVRFLNSTISDEALPAGQWYWGDAGDACATIAAYRPVPPASPTAVPPALQSQE